MAQSIACFKIEHGPWRHHGKSWPSKLLQSNTVRNPTCNIRSQNFRHVHLPTSPSFCLRGHSHGHGAWDVCAPRLVNIMFLTNMTFWISSSTEVAIHFIALKHSFRMWMPPRSPRPLLAPPHPPHHPATPLLPPHLSRVEKVRRIGTFVSLQCHGAWAIRKVSQIGSR